MNEIIKTAESFVNKLNEEEPLHPDYEYGFDSNPKEFFECWYFDFKIIPKREIPKNKTGGFGGAPGFIIFKKDRKAKIIAFWRKHELEEEQIRRIELNKILSQIEKENWNTALIRKLTGIKPRNILELKKRFNSYDFSKEENRILVIKEIEKLKKENDR